MKSIAISGYFSILISFYFSQADLMGGVYLPSWLRSQAWSITNPGTDQYSAGLHYGDGEWLHEATVVSDLEEVQTTKNSLGGGIQSTPLQSYVLLRMSTLADLEEYMNVHFPRYKVCIGHVPLGHF